MAYVIKVKNNSGSTKIWCGKEFTDQEEYTIPYDSNRGKWTQNSGLITAIGNSEAQIGNGSSYFTNANDAINWLKGEFPVDADQSMIIRTKAAKAGWVYHMHAMQVETGILDSLVEEDADGNSLGYSNIKFYDSNGIELTTQVNITASCVKTVVDFEPPFDYEIIGGKVQTLATPGSSIRLWVRAVPDLTYAQGGSRDMVENIDLQYISNDGEVNADGRASKYMAYNTTYHTNKLRVILKHGIAVTQKIQIIYEMYKA